MNKLYNTELDIVNGLKDFFTNIDFNFSKPQIKTLPHIITSIIKAENITTADISKTFIDDSFLTNNESVQKKLWRFFNNYRFNGLDFFNASIKHIQDYEDEKSASIVRKYHEIKKEIKEEMKIRIPQILRGCSELIKEDSDFRKIHLELNDEMNKKLQQYVEGNVLPQMYDSLNTWLASCNEEFLDSKAFLEEMSARFNEIYGEEVVQLQGDFKILEDWARDINRMTSSVRVDRENILLRHTTSQFLFKSAGKIFGAISQNKTLFNQYKKFIDNENYEETTNSVISRFFMQFELFEKALERDMALFFKQPIQDLKTNVQIAHTEIENKEELLMEMKTKPEIYFDAITLFKIRLRQQEIMNMVK